MDGGPLSAESGFGSPQSSRKGFDFTNGVANAEPGPFPLFSGGRSTPPASTAPFVFGSTSHQRKKQKLSEINIL